MLIMAIVLFVLQVTGMHNAGDFPITANYVQPRRSGIIPGAYVELPVMRPAVAIRLDVQTMGTLPRFYNLASLTEVEVFVRGEHVYDRLVCRLKFNACYWTFVDAKLLNKLYSISVKS